MNCYEESPSHVSKGETDQKKYDWYCHSTLTPKPTHTPTKERKTKQKIKGIFPLSCPSPPPPPLPSYDLQFRYNLTAYTRPQHS